jgi:hypothetical protein
MMAKKNQCKSQAESQDLHSGELLVNHHLLGAFGIVALMKELLCFDLGLEGVRLSHHRAETFPDARESARLASI